MGDYALKLLNPALAGKLDLSGVVQKTLLEAAAATPPDDPARVGYWLRALLKRNLLDEVKWLTAAKRDVGREVPWDGQDQPTTELTPSRQAVRAEDILALAGALARLPTAQQDVIRMRYLDDLGVDQIVARTGKTRPAVAGLLRRGIEGLRQQLREPSP
jgi:RNA polymerase sigma-70 factor (ECF subfamily)